MLVTAEDAFGLLEALPGRIGLADSEINRWESELCMAFPPEFRRLLRLSGRSLCWLFPGGLNHPSDILNLRRRAAEVTERSDWSLGDNDIVLGIVSQGCGFVFLRPSADGARVWRYYAGAAKDSGLNGTVA